MKYRILIILLPALLWLPAISQNRSILFVEKPWGQILAQAKAEKKIIFLDAYTTWCGPCKWMAANMFTRDTVADFYNKSFICVHFDMEKGEGLSLAQEYQVSAYPTLLFINPEGEVVHKRVGAPQKVSDYLEMGQIALTPGEGLTDYMRRFSEGIRDPVFMIKYLGRLQGAYMPVAEAYKIYFSTQKEPDLLNRTNWEIIYRYESDYQSPVFLFVLEHRKEYEKRYTRDSVSQMLSGVYMQSIRTALQNRDTYKEAIRQIRIKFKEQGTPEAQAVILNLDLSMLQRDGETARYLALADSLVDQYFMNDPVMLVNVTRTFMSMTADKKYLEKAARWGKKALEMNDTHENNDLYANLMFMIGRKPEAVKYEKRAIELSEKNNGPTEYYRQNLGKFEK